LLNWIYLGWKYLLRTIVIVGVGIVFLGIVLFTFLQLPFLQKSIAGYAERLYNASFDSELSIGYARGFIPFNMELGDVLIQRTDTLIFVRSVDVRISPIDFFRGQIGVQSIAVKEPFINLVLDDEGEFYELERAFQSREEAKERTPVRLSEYEIFAPFISVQDGRLLYSARQPGMPLSERDTPTELTDIQLSAFIESTSLQRYADLGLFQFSIPEISNQPYVFRGQIYNDARFLELNSFVFEHSSNIIRVSGEIDGLNLFQIPINEQLQVAEYALRVDTASVYPRDFRPFFNDLPDLRHRIDLDFEAEGTLQEMIIRQSRIRYGKSEISFVGDLKEMADLQNISYDGNIRQLNIDQYDLFELFPEFATYRFLDWNRLTLRGRVSGNLEETRADLTISTRKGVASLTGELQWSATPAYNLVLGSQGLDLKQFDSLELALTEINGEIGIQGRGLSLNDADIRFLLNLNNTSLGAYKFDELIVEGRLYEEELIATMEILSGESKLNSSLEASLWPPYVLKINGDGTSLQPGEFLLVPWAESINLDVVFAAEFEGTNIDDITARVSLDVSSGESNGTLLPEHQLYADLFDDSDGRRRFRMTSTILDLNLVGDLYPTKIAKSYEQWISYVDDRIREEILLEQQDDSRSSIQTPAPNFPGESLNLEFDFFARDTLLISLYAPESQFKRANFRGSGRVESNGDRVLISGGVTADEFHYSDFQLNQFDLQFTSNLNYNRRIREFAVIDFKFKANQITNQTVAFESVQLSGSLLNGDVMVRTDVGNIGYENYGLNFTATATLGDTTLFATLLDLSIGDASYRWVLQDMVNTRYHSNNSLEIDLFRIVNNGQVVDIWGTFSSEPSDSMNYRFRNVDIGTISNIVGGRVGFAGNFEGDLITRSLLSQPAIAGDVLVKDLRMNDRLLGDLILNSAFDAETNRFDTRLQIYTDPERYSEYLSQNRGIGQHIIAEGWFSATGGTQDSVEALYWFDVDLREIDGWILQPISPSIFVSTEGQASGRGYITGNRDDFDFNAVFEVSELQGIAAFLMTEYLFSGQVEVDRNDGVLLNNVAVSDRLGGSGILNGVIGFNDFAEERPLNIALSMERLQFLNNNFNPEIPFYGTVAGTGLVTLTGSNITPFIRTVTPVSTTQESRLTIPLLPETVVDEQSRFIEFVRSFDEVFAPRSEFTEQNGGQAQPDRTFAETFRLDLQFIAPPRTTVQLLFDPLTNEVLNARGNGRIRITLEDQVFQMFGGFNVNSGDYTFVGGDIFVRRFQLRDGGTLNWEGDPANARLNITASYRTRPNIGLLTSAAIEQQTRIPVDLILDITGTIQAIENDFYFEFPNAVDVTQNATELALLNSEDQKLLQATSLLFTGGFLPIGTASESQFAELSTSLQARAGQVGLSQLLSNQINNLLSSSLSMLDVDLNLTGFDQADLGVALRLFDDRLILRGESQFTSGAETGTETTLGDFGVTYSINRNLSLEVFHRRDPTLRSIVGNQSQAESINGIGLEAQIQFNTWSDLRIRVVRQIRSLLGIKPKETTDNSYLNTLSTTSGTS
jgi:hypothetical protein